MRFASITFLACAILVASPDIVMGASTGSKGPAVKPAPAPAVKPKVPAPAATSTAAAPKPTNLTHNKCPTGTLSCSTQTKVADHCCFEQYGEYVLSQQWVKGLGTDDYFTMHGMWPNTCASTLTPKTGCDSTRVYKKVEALIKPLKPALVTDMTKYWPSKRMPNDEFWGHEWSKHGTCVSTLRPQCYNSYTKNQDIVDYFTNAINLHKKYDYAAALKDHKIMPDNMNVVSATDFKKAIHAKYGVNVVLKCKTNPATNVSELSEVWTYFNVQDLNTYIPTQPNSKDSCASKFLYFEK
ncbi:hypothetical protein EC988_004804 [Linderina pennispora]|nr:hypothetical protein EC988_004804 [Linderina pennispora]